MAWFRPDVARAIAAEAARRVVARSDWTLARLSRRHPRPDRILLTPPDIRPADPAFARDMYESRFRFAGVTVGTHGESPFQIEPPSDAWAEELHAFRWLRHLSAAGSELAAANARALVGDWIESHEQQPARHAMAAGVAARRLIAWLQHAGIILSNADHIFYRQFVRSLGRHVRRLETDVALMRMDEDRLRARIAIALAALALLPQGSAVADSTRRLARELDRQILPDGCHVSRSPAAVAHLLADLLPLRACCAEQGRPVPPALVAAIDRMLPALRFFVHRDGSLALFNGTADGQAGLVAAILAHDETGARPLSAAPHGGYQRLAAGVTVVVADTGNPPPLQAAAHAHAGALSFELSSGRSRIVGNCGVDHASPLHGPLGRATAAHSTATVGDSSSARFAYTPGVGAYLGIPLMKRGDGLRVERQDARGVAGFLASHDGYAASHGLRHQRSLELSAEGSILSGQDSFLPVSGETVPPSPVAIRFHLDPSVAAAYDDAGDIVLETPDGERWRFSASPVRGTLEESVQFATAAVRPARQIVLAARAERMAAVNWRISRA